MKAEHNKTDHIYSSSLSNWNGVMESGGVIWVGVCAVAWNVERYAMWNEAEWAVTRRYVVVEVVLCEISGGCRMGY